MFWKHFLVIWAWPCRVLLGFEAPGPGRARFDLGKRFLGSYGLLEISSGLPGLGRVAASLEIAKFLGLSWQSRSVYELICTSCSDALRMRSNNQLQQLFLFVRLDPTPCCHAAAREVRVVASCWLIGKPSEDVPCLI